MQVGGTAAVSRSAVLLLPDENCKLRCKPAPLAERHVYMGAESRASSQAKLCGFPVLSPFELNWVKPAALIDWSSDLCRSPGFHCTFQPPSYSLGASESVRIRTMNPSVRVALLAAALLCAAVAAPAAAVRLPGLNWGVDICETFSKDECAEHADTCILCKASFWISAQLGHRNAAWGWPACVRPAPMLRTTSLPSCDLSPAFAMLSTAPLQAWDKVDVCFETEIAKRLPAKLFNCSWSPEPQPSPSPVPSPEPQPSPEPVPVSTDCQDHKDEVGGPLFYVMVG